MTTLYAGSASTDGNIRSEILTGSFVYPDANMKTRGGSCDGCKVTLGIGLASDFTPTDAGSISDCFTTVYGTVANLQESGSILSDVIPAGNDRRWQLPSGSIGELVSVLQFGSSGLAGTTFVFAENFLGTSGGLAPQDIIINDLVFSPASPTQDDKIIVTATTGSQVDYAMASLVKDSVTVGIAEAIITGTAIEMVFLPWMYGTFGAGTMFISGWRNAGEVGDMVGTSISVGNGPDSPQHAYYEELRSLLKSTASLSHIKDTNIRMLKHIDEIQGIESPGIGILPDDNQPRLADYDSYKHEINHLLVVNYKDWHQSDAEDMFDDVFDDGNTIIELLKDRNWNSGAYKVLARREWYSAFGMDSEIEDKIFIAVRAEYWK